MNELQNNVFEDVFTQDSNGIHLSVDRAEINCLTSKTNAFGLDSEGNLTVKSIQLEEGSTIDYLSILDRVYPVGSIYISINDANPTTLFGGVWSSFATGKTLVGVDDTQTEFDTVEKSGGTKNDLLTQAQIPSMDIGVVYGDNNKSVNLNATGNANAYGISSWNSTAWDSRRELIARYVNNSQQKINNLQPYITVYMWKRTA